MLTALIVRTRTPAYPGTVKMLQHNPDNTPVRVLGCESAAEARTLCDAEPVDVVLVQHDEDALCLSRHPPNAPVALSPYAAVSAAFDKVTLLQCAKEVKVPHPSYAVVQSPAKLHSAAQGLGYPDRKLVVRPVRSWGARGLCLVTDQPLAGPALFSNRPRYHRVTLEQLQDSMEGAPPFLLTEYLPGKEYSVDAFVGTHCEVAISRERTHVHGGVSIESVLDYRSDIQEMTLAMAKALGLTSIFGMQFRLDEEGTPRILECNPRIQGTTIASHLSGVNLVWLAVQEAMGTPPTAIPQQTKQGHYIRPWSC